MLFRQQLSERGAKYSLMVCVDDQWEEGESLAHSKRPPVKVKILLLSLSLPLHPKVQ